MANGENSITAYISRLEQFESFIIYMLHIADAEVFRLVSYGHGRGFSIILRPNAILIGARRPFLPFSLRPQFDLRPIAHR